MAIEPKESDRPIIFEWIEVAGKGIDFALKPITGGRAFRKYNVFLGPALNSVKNLRGMVINAKMRSVYVIAGDVGEGIAVISALIAVGQEYARIQKVWNSNVRSDKKFSHITLLASAAVLRSITSIVPTGVHLAALTIEGYALLYSLASGSRSGNALANKIAAADAKITEIHKQQWDGENWYNVIIATVQ